MAKQTINLGTTPTGVGGDTPRSAFTKTQANFDEIYTALGGTTIPAALPVAKGGTGGTTATAARTALGLKSAAIVDVVGNVNGTTPTAILETGTTAAGTYIKYADGTLICHALGSNTVTGTVAAGTVGMEVICNLPASYVGSFIAYMVAGPTLSNDHYGITNAYGYTSSQVAGVLRNGSVSQSFALRWITIGRWK